MKYIGLMALTLSAALACPLQAMAQANLSIDDVASNEGDSGTTEFRFTVSLDAPAPAGGVSFDIATSEGTADTTDYESNALMAATIAEGDSAITFTVNAYGDRDYEADETFFVEAGNVAGAQIADARAQGTILNDELIPEINAQEAWVVEGDSGFATAVVQVSLSYPSARTVTVDYAAVDGRAVAPEDYESRAGTLSFAPGQTRQTIEIRVVGDLEDEQTEYFEIVLSNAVDANFGESSARVYVVTDDSSDFTISPPTLPNGALGDRYDQPLYTQRSGTAFAITSGTLPPGIELVVFNDRYYLIGVPTVAGSFDFTVVATSGGPLSGSGSASRSYTLVIDNQSALVLPPTVLPDGLSSERYQQALNPATGGTPPYAYAVTAGALPNGVQLSPSATLYGVPSGGGRFDFTITATDSTAGSPRTASRDYTLVIAPLQLQPSYSPLNMYYGRPYSLTFQTVGSDGPFVYTVSSGTLPAGIALVGDTLTGVPTVPGSYPVRIAVTDTGTGTSVSNAYTIEVNAVPFLFTPNVLPDFIVGGTGSLQIFIANGIGPYDFSLVSGSLPPGLELSDVGVLSGTPTMAGSYSFVVAAVDANGRVGTQSYTTTIAPLAPLVLASGALADANVAQPYLVAVGSTTGGVPPYRYAVTAGVLPDGLSLVGAGAISGTPTRTGSFEFIVTVTDSGMASQRVSAVFTINVVRPELVLTPDTLPEAFVGQFYDSSFVTTNGNFPYTYAITAGALPPGVSLTQYFLFGNPTTPGRYDFSVTVTDGTPDQPLTLTRDYSLLVSVLPMEIDPPSLPPAEAGRLYSLNITASGGVAPYTYRVGAGQLPPGMRLLDDGTLSGTPSAIGAFDFTVVATDSASGAPVSATREYRLEVALPVLSMYIGSYLPPAVGVPYSTEFQTNNGIAPYRYTITQGVLPTGMTLAQDGQLSGTPSTEGRFDFTVTVTDSSTGFGPLTLSKAFSLLVGPTRLVLNTVVLPGATEQTPYSFRFDIVGGATPYRFQFVDGIFPAGLTLNADGTITGTPSRLPDSAGSFAQYYFQFRVTDAEGRSETFYRDITVNRLGLSLTPDAVPAGIAGTPYELGFTAGGGVAPYRLNLTGPLPAGLGFDAATGRLSGTPTEAGQFDFQLTVTDARNDVLTYNYFLTIATPTITLTPAALPAGTAGVAYRQTFSASGGVSPYVYIVGDRAGGQLPPGLMFSSAGVLSGTPTAAGTFAFSVTAIDSTGGTFATITNGYTLRIDAPAIAISPATLPNGTRTAVYSQTLSASGGTAPYAYAITAGALPVGVGLTSAGAISGTPTVAGNSPFTVTATDALGFTGQQAYTLAIVELPPVAVDDIATATGTSPVNIAVTANDTGVFASIGIVPSFAPGNGTALVSGLNVIYTANAGFSGTDTFRYMLTGPGGSSTATVTVTVNPIPVGLSRTVDAVAGLSMAVDLTEGATGGPFTAATLVALTPASSGTASIAQAGNGANARYVLTYTPTARYTGIATATFTLRNAFATSAVATITFDVAPRPDPSQDAEVRGLLNAQVESTRRFANAQIGNFQQRLERMHGAGEENGFDNGLSVSYDQYCPDVVGALPGRRCQRPTAGETGISAMQQTRDKRNDAAFAIWTSGMIRSGNRDGRNGDANVDFETDGVSVGADYRVSDAFAFGGGLGYGRDESEIGDNGSRSESDAFTLALYASYSPGERWFVDALLGYQSLGFDLRRFVATNGNSVVGSRDGTQWFGSVSTGADIQRGAWQFTPYARVDVAQATLDAYSESGDPLYALVYGDLDVDTTTGNAGLRIDYRRDMSWGLLSPQFRVEYQHDFKGNGAQTIRYADLPAGPFYRAGLTDFDRTRLMLGLGVLFDLNNDWSFKIDYRGLIGSGDDTDHGYQFNVDKKF